VSISTDDVMSGSDQAESVRHDGSLVVLAFLRHLAASLRAVEARAEPEAVERIFHQLYCHLCSHVEFFLHAHNDPRVHPDLRIPTNHIEKPPRHLYMRVASYAWRLLKARLPFVERAVRLRDALHGSLQTIAAWQGCAVRGVLDRLHSFLVLLGIERLPGPAPPAEAAPILRPTAKVMQALAHMPDSELKKLAEAIVDLHPNSIAKARELCREFTAAATKGQVVVFLTVGFPTSWAPLAMTLTESGVRSYAVCLYDYSCSTETGVLNTREIPVHSAHVLDLLGHLVLLGNPSGASILVNTDGYYHAAWDPERTLLMYMLAGAMLAARGRERKAADGKIVAFKYDAVQPVRCAAEERLDRNPSRLLLSDFFIEHLQQCDAIIYNANSTAMGAFLESEMRLNKPRLHFYRYSSKPRLDSARLEWRNAEDIHIVVLAPFLSDSDDHTRNRYAPVVRGIIEQKLHVHYFCNVDNPVVLEFEESLGSSYREYFHPHQVIRNQRELVECVQCYHVGLILSDDSAFLHSINDLHDAFYREAIALMRKSTTPSAPFVLAGAGLPFICPPYMESLPEIFGPEIAMPIAPTDLDRLRQTLETCDLPRRMAVAKTQRHNAWMESNVRRLLDFLAS